jgi:hypothetical protein
LSGIKKKDLKLDPKVKLKRWGARASIEEMMLLAEQNGVDITYLGMCVRPQRYTRIATVLVALSNGQIPPAIEPPRTEGLILCNYWDYRHWARPEEFEQNPLEAPGTLCRLCKSHHEKNIGGNRKIRARNRIEGGTKGDGENTGKIRCSSNYQGSYGHWCEEEDFIDPSYKYCRACILKNSGMQRKLKRTDAPNGTIVLDGPWKGMIQCRNVHCVRPDEYGPEKSPGEYHTACLRHRLMLREVRQSHCRRCGYTYETGSETKEEHAKSCSRRFCDTCRRNFSIDELYDHKDDCYLKLKEYREVLVEKGICAWFPYHNYYGCSEKPVEGRQRCQYHSEKYYEALLNTSAGKKELLPKLLGNEGQESIRWLIDAQPHLVELIDQLDELLLDSPERVLFWDTEFFGNHAQDIEPTATPYICQISIRNGRYDEVIPVATVRYPMTKSELWDLSGCEGTKWPGNGSLGTFRKFYGRADDNPVTGLNGVFSLGLEEIATLLENYYEKHALMSGECICIEWSTSGYLDHKNVVKALRKVGKQNLVPNLPLRSAETTNPMAWWRTLRECVEKICSNRKQPLERMGLNLGNMYSIIFPDDRATLLKQHTADADVKMLFEITKCFLNIYNGRPYTGQIERYFKKVEVEVSDSDSEPVQLKRPRQKKQDVKKADAKATRKQSKLGPMDQYLKGARADKDTNKKSKTAPIKPRAKNAKAKAANSSGPMDQFVTKSKAADKTGNDLEADEPLSKEVSRLGKGKRGSVESKTGTQRSNKKRKLS